MFLHFSVDQSGLLKLIYELTPQSYELCHFGYLLIVSYFFAQGDMHETDYDIRELHSVDGLLFEPNLHLVTLIPETMHLYFYFDDMIRVMYLLH